VTEEYGDTVATWSSFLWLGSTLHYTVPDSSESHLVRTEYIGSDTKNIHPVVDAWKSSSLGNVALKVEGIGASAGVTLFKSEVNGVNFTKNGKKWEPGVLALSMTGVYFFTGALEIKAP
jgi:hypothetical protein